MMESRRIRASVEPIDELRHKLDEIKAMLELADEVSDEATFAEAEKELVAADHLYEKLETQALLTEPGDEGNCYLSVQAGTGGTDANDWAQMLFELYMRWARKQGYDVEIIDYHEDEVAGIRSASAPSLACIGGQVLWGLACIAGFLGPNSRPYSCHI
jgi:peptide chain release factor 2